jgi:hypothetical protein
MENAGPQVTSGAGTGAAAWSRKRKGSVRKVDVLETVFELIDMRSFSNLWYWIALAVLWSSTSHWVLGVPHDMIQRARREGGQAQQDLEDIVRINATRLLWMVDHGALVIVGLAAFWLTGLAVLAFWYDVEFAQAVFFLVFPMVFVVTLSVRVCRRIMASENTGEALYRRMIVHRRWMQGIGMMAIFFTAMYGMWQNVSNSILH